jgi:peroxiredoxin Q/BCP
VSDGDRRALLAAGWPGGYRYALAGGDRHVHMPLQAGDPAPAVSAHNQHGERVEVPLDGPTVLYFYPRDGTSGCTTEATQFEGEMSAFREAEVAVYGVSVDDVDSHRAFAADHDLTFDLLADPDREIADAYDVPEGPAGTTSRTTFVLFGGQVHTVYEGVRPDGHARDVLEDLLSANLVELEW